jgi:hypothetical protein
MSKNLCSLINCTGIIYCPQFHAILRLKTGTSLLHGLSHGCVAGRISYVLEMGNRYVIIKFFTSMWVERRIRCALL